MYYGSINSVKCLLYEWCYVLDPMKDKKKIK